MQSQSSTNPIQTDEPPLSDAEIEAEYFPGTAAVSPSEVAFDLETIRFYPSEAEWCTDGTGGVGLLISGTEHEANPERLADARGVISELSEIAPVAIAIARAFIKQEGSWSMSEVNLGRSAQENKCDFQIGLDFFPADGSDSHGYVTFSVCFRFHQVQGIRRGYHQAKFVVEFL